jgi:predicted PurR-regulated permease PerM
MSDRETSVFRPPPGLLVITALALYLTYLVARPFVGALTWGLAFAVVSFPIQRWLEGRTGRPALSAALTVIIVGCLLLGPAVFVADRMVRQAVVAIQMIDRDGPQYWQQIVARAPRLAEWAAWIGARVDLQDGLREIAGRIPNLLKGSVGLLAELLVGLFCLFFFLRDRGSLLASLRTLLPLSQAEVDVMFGRIWDTIHASIFGRLMVAFAQGAVGGLMFWILGLPAPLVWTLVMTFLALLPSLGPFLVWVPAAMWLALVGRWGAAIVMTLWGLLVVSLIDNALYPFLVGARMQMHPMTVFVSVIGGLALFGPSGLVLGPVLFAVTGALLDVWRDRSALESVGGREPSEPIPSGADSQQ